MTDTQIITEQFTKFLKDSKSLYHGVIILKQQLLENGFIHLYESAPWPTLEPGAKYFFTRNQATIYAFIMPIEPTPAAFSIVAGHTDAPCLRLKPQGTITNGMVPVEPYGSVIARSWIAHDLCLAGRVSFMAKGKMHSHLVDFGEQPIGHIFDLAPHLSRNLPAKTVVADPDKSLNPFVSTSAATIEELVKPVAASAAGCEEKDVVGLAHTLEFTDAQGPRVMGDLILGQRLDNLSSTFACFQAILGQEPHQHHVKMAAAFDHEEVGSTTREGANNAYIRSLIDRIMQHSGVPSPATLDAVLARSWMTSMDVAHAKHHAFPGLADPVIPTVLGKGVALKLAQRQSYATGDANSAVLLALAHDSGAEVQISTVKNSARSGGTIGNKVASHSGIRTVDLGIPLHGMHSLREAGSVSDMVNLLKLTIAILEHAPVKLHEMLEALEE
eukprot:gnl/Dysnectes_brevis/1419_a1604_2152.p1 GENE.gnl/Dysnectes_brevis/1419_a1604_2152~~gnl/Dysnectes_brevis/1419_a1604_2152.p1  ORF type:complete len:453 (-),score=148.82 gnl/Dysnectes_brevis/1419_a1604_2152:44-1372(-)